LLKRHYKLIIAIFIFLPLVVFIDKVVFSYLEPKAAAAAKKAENTQMLYGAKCAMCHGIKGEGTGGYPKIGGLAKEVALSKIKSHKEGIFGEGVQLRADFTTLSDADKEEIASFVATLKGE
jgi:cytochrome c553